MPDTLTTDVVIIGAGLSGLTAARHLTASGVDVVVLEASDRVGGRTRNQEVGGLTVDLGGTFVGPGQDHVVALATELGLTTFPTYDQGAQVMAVGARRREYQGSTFPIGPLRLAQARDGDGDHRQARRHRPERGTMEGAPRQRMGRADPRGLAAFARRRRPAGHAVLVRHAYLVGLRASRDLVPARPALRAPGGWPVAAAGHHRRASGTPLPRGRRGHQ
nr:FAD-dependent oxidoreductase [Demequina litorisediminis]